MEDQCINGTDSTVTFPSTPHYEEDDDDESIEEKCDNGSNNERYLILEDDGTSRNRFSLNGCKEKVCEGHSSLARKEGELVYESKGITMTAALNGECVKSGNKEIPLEAISSMNIRLGDPSGSPEMIESPRKRMRRTELEILYGTLSSTERTALHIRNSELFDRPGPLPKVSPKKDTLKKSSPGKTQAAREDSRSSDREVQLVDVSPLIDVPEQGSSSDGLMIGRPTSSFDTSEKDLISLCHSAAKRPKVNHNRHYIRKPIDARSIKPTFSFREVFCSYPPKLAVKMGELVPVYDGTIKPGERLPKSHYIHRWKISKRTEKRR